MSDPIGARTPPGTDDLTRPAGDAGMPAPAHPAGGTIRVDGLSKSYQIYAKPQHRLWQGLLRGRRQFFQEFWALSEVSFDVGRGEVVGIIGRNGSGKSTLLQIICGTVSATRGTVAASGRIAALLELGAGFSPEFSGIENVYLNASVLGLERAEIDRRLDEILAFADIGDFARQPIKTYSSGMFVRLAFAVAACVEPDILVVDEALAVGDVQYQSKCFRRFESLREKGTTILLVTHSTEQVVRHCTRALLLESGRLLADGEPRSVVNRYLDLVLGVPQAAPREPGPAVPLAVAATTTISTSPLTGRFEERDGYSRAEYRWGNRQAEIVDFAIVADGEPGHRVRFWTGQHLTVWMRAQFRAPCDRPIFGLYVKTPDGVTVFGNNSRDAATAPVVPPVGAGTTVEVQFRLVLALGAGEYLLSLGVAADVNGEIVPLDRRYDAVQIHVSNERRSVGLAELQMSCTVTAL
jgi:lipopolysaccharide transport system ATP-binding protein